MQLYPTRRRFEVEVPLAVFCLSMIHRTRRILGTFSRWRRRRMDDRYWRRSHSWKQSVRECYSLYSLLTSCNSFSFNHKSILASLVFLIKQLFFISLYPMHVVHFWYVNQEISRKALNTKELCHKIPKILGFNNFNLIQVVPFLKS